MIHLAAANYKSHNIASCTSVRDTTTITDIGKRENRDLMIMSRQQTLVTVFSDSPQKSFLLA